MASPARTSSRSHGKTVTKRGSAANRGRGRDRNRARDFIEDVGCRECGCGKAKGNFDAAAVGRKFLQVFG
jgi:hypothetical protein